MCAAVGCEDLRCFAGAWQGRCLGYDCVVSIAFEMCGVGDPDPVSFA